MKSLPLSDLEVVAMLFQTGEYVDDDSGSSYPEFELEVYNEPLRAASTFDKFAGRCDCCGN